MNDIEQIENIVQLYIDSLDESNPDKVKETFHENAKVVGYLHGNFMEMSVDDFAGFVASQQPSPKEKSENVVFEILTCEIEGTTALVKVRDKYLGITFLDTLSFIKNESEWKIYNKLFNVESE
ncbi:MAG: nuclear transport factor 2 family protein [Woeseiaceae bacterium]|tara:strand:- start:188 stop:556 length:369 start_codon:yes stop_codon:yes gene_type:complete